MTLHNLAPNREGKSCRIISEILNFSYILHPEANLCTKVYEENDVAQFLEFGFSKIFQLNWKVI